MGVGQVNVKAEISSPVVMIGSFVEGTTRSAKDVVQTWHDKVLWISLRLSPITDKLQIRITPPLLEVNLIKGAEAGLLMAFLEQAEVVFDDGLKDAPVRALIEEVELVAGNWKAGVVSLFTTLDIDDTLEFRLTLDASAIGTVTQMAQCVLGRRPVVQ